MSENTPSNRRSGSDDRRPRRSGPGKPGRTDGPRRGKPGEDRRGGAGRSGERRGERPSRDGERPRREGQRRDDRPRRDGDRPQRGGRPGGDRERRDVVRRDDRPRKPREVEVEEPVYPAVDEDVEPKQLDRFARRELAGLDKEKADFVANHLVMASRVVDENPELAHQHALAALAKGSRIPVVRESLGITAYLCGDFALALRELRTHRRLTRSDLNVPMMIDCERGLGRPDKGIELGREVKRSELPADVQVELAIALSGCRLDQGQPDRALLELDIPQRDPNKAFSYSPALFDAYAVVLAELGRDEEAAEWGQRANVAAEALAEAQETDDLQVTDTEDPHAVVEDDTDGQGPAEELT
jgi:hypothetical protein